MSLAPRVTGVRGALTSARAPRFGAPVVARRLVAPAIAACCAVGAVAVPAGGAASSGGGVKVGVDRKTNVSFSVSGRMIDITLRPVGDAPNPLLSELSGQSIAVACKGAHPRRGGVSVAVLETSWPASAAMMRGRLSRDVSSDMQWCVLELPDGGDIAVTRKLRAPRPSASPTPSPAPTTPTP